MTDLYRELTTINVTTLGSKYPCWTFGEGSASATTPAFFFDIKVETLARVDVSRSFGELARAGDTVACRSRDTGTPGHRDTGTTVAVLGAN